MISNDKTTLKGLVLAGVKPPAPPAQAPPKSAVSSVPPKGRLKKAANENFDARKTKKQTPNPARKRQKISGVDTDRRAQVYAVR